MNRVAVSIAALVCTLSLATTASAQSCYREVAVVICDDCSFSICSCAYNGAACSSYNIVCASRIKLEEGFAKGPSYQEPCWFSRRCRSEMGGPCNSENPCVQYDDVIYGPLWWDHDLTHLCDEA